MQYLMSTIVNLTSHHGHVGVRNTIKNFSAPKYLAYICFTTLLCHLPLLSGPPLCHEHYDQRLVSAATSTLTVSTVVRPAQHHSYCQTRSFAHLDNAMIIRHMGMKTTQHTFKRVTFRVSFWEMCYTSDMYFSSKGVDSSLVH